MGIIRKQKSNGLLFASLTFAGITIVSLFLLGAISFVIAGGIAYQVWLRSERGKSIVLWLRRFRPTSRHFNFANCLNQVRVGAFVPVTLQDSSYRRSYARNSTGLILIGGLLLFNMVFWLSFATIAIGALSLGMKSESLQLAFSIGASAVIAGACTWLYFRTRTYAALAAESAIATSDSMIAKIRGSSGFYSGTLVLQSPDDIWRQLVEHWIASASAVIVDVTEVSDNLAWELGVAKRELGLKAIVLAVEQHGEPQLPPKVARILDDVLGEGWQDIPIVWYPHRTSSLWPPPGPQYARVAKALKAALIVSL